MVNYYKVLDTKNKVSVFFILGVIGLFGVSILFELTKSVSFDIFLAIYTALATTSMITLTTFIIDYNRVKQYIGIWQVMEFGSEEYKETFSYVEINRLSNEELSYRFKDADNFQIMEGIIYINKNSRDNGKLISRYEFVNFQNSKFYPINEKSVFFDRKLSVGENVSPIIRVLDLNGLEDFILVSPKNQITFKEKLDKRYEDNFDEYIYQQGLPILNL